jgi:hypothetical protein
LLLLAHDVRGDSLALNRERNEDGFALISGDAFTSKGDVFDLEIYRAHRAL